MASFAGLLAELGHEVSGSDRDFYPPMSELLKKIKIRLFRGYSRSNVEAVMPLDLAVVGNAISAGNEEVDELLRRNVEIFSFPEALYHLVMKDKERIVVAGTHGKTTTSAMLAFCLNQLGISAGYLVGGILRDTQRSFAPGERIFVVEGDEYETSFFDKGPKFAHYFPKYAVLNPVEFDHGDIFASMEDVIRSFSLLVKQLPSSGLLLSYDSPHNRRVAEWSQAPVVFFSEREESDIYFSDLRVERPGYSFSVHIKGREDGRYRIKLIESVNVLNSLPVIFLLREVFSFPHQLVSEALSSFSGVRRRMDTVAITEELIFLADFAHHPTAFRRNITDLKRMFPERKVIVIVEPRTWSMRKRTFQSVLPESLREADAVILAPVYQPERIPEQERLRTDKVAEELRRMGREAFACTSWEEVREKASQLLSGKDVLVLFSNGRVDHHISALLEAAAPQR